MILGTKARYAVMAMVDLAERSAAKPVTLAELAQSQNIPLPYLEQIFAKLRKCQLVDSVRGPGGGYILNKPAEQTFVSDIVEAAEESIKMTRCEGPTQGCVATKTRCKTHDLWEGLGQHIYDYLHSVSLADVCNQNIKLATMGKPAITLPGDETAFN